MTDEEHTALVERVRAGLLFIGMERSIARQLYMNVPLSRIASETGEQPRAQKALVWFFLLASYATLFAGFIAAWLAFGWWAVAVIPASTVAYFSFSGVSSLPGRGMLVVGALLAVALLALVLHLLPSAAAWFLVLVALSLCSIRAVYCSSIAFAHALVLRNRRAYEFLIGHIHTQEAHT